MRSINFFYIDSRSYLAYRLLGIALLCFLSFEVLGQDEDQPDLREESCRNCTGQANNFNILNAYFSDESGESKDICEDNGPYFISLLYLSQPGSNVHNFRIIADIQKKVQNTEDLLDSFYMNEFVGTVQACPNGPCIITIPIPDLGFECGNEYYELSNPMSFWTNRANINLQNSYKCNDYPTAQCSTSESIPIEVGFLEYDFDVSFECFQENLDHTNVDFLITSLFGGNPTAEYNVVWDIEFEGETIIQYEEINPSFENVESGTLVTATLTISQNDINGDPIPSTSISKTIIIPVALGEEDIIESSTVINSDEEENNGIIEVEFKEGNFVYYWTSVDDPDFYSEDSRIEDLPIGTYVLTTFDAETRLCRTDVFEIVRILPVEFKYVHAEHDPQHNNVILSWATAKEWENSHFEIERSISEISDFEKIAEVEGMGWTDQITEYEYVDEQLPLGGKNLLYRLKQVDFNGNFEYSEVVSVRVPGVEFTQGVWRAYPNPTNGSKLRIGLMDRSQYEDERLSFRIIHPMYVTPSKTVDSETEMNVLLEHLALKVPKGVFVVEIQWGQKVEHIKILKQLQ
ncbi:MAG: hypothetical protein EA341_06735 [Mongoliibacter sp.]|uniref:hypothetical protein n=1 Tax=Mongoliibacter sp. TaxID=2022438 RepID=UPI0012F2F4F1|nr:hypothetical protein [Mongoliibacter sp.]TVP50827.1 MAG: hypothetical protein EA341_06735 [Mongoliibacter sp.]